MWLRALVVPPPAHFPLGRSLRLAVAVAAPVAVATAMGAAHLGMWIAMGAMLAGAGERDTAYSVRFRQLAITGLFGAAGLLFGYVAHWPPPVIIALMTAVAFASGLLSGMSSVLSSATMQLLMLSSMAIGLAQLTDYGTAALLFLVGVAFTAALLGVEAGLDRRRPQRAALVGMLHALGAAARARADGDHGDAALDHAGAAIARLRGIVVAHRSRAQGPTREYDRAAAITRAADALLVRLAGPGGDRAADVALAVRLDELAVAVHAHRSPGPGSGDDRAVVALQRAIWPGDAGKVSPEATAPRRRPRSRFALPSVGRELVVTSARLALCMALAYTAAFLLQPERGYWIALTVALVMKPDLGSIFVRGVQRVVGTAVGVFIALLVTAVIVVPYAEIAAMAVLAAMIPWAATRSYAMRVVFLTPVVLLLLGIIDHEPPLETGLLRLLTTAIAGAIVIVAGYLICPSARHCRVEVPFAAVVGALADYARDLAAAADDDARYADRGTVYRSLSDLEVTLQRALGEPPPAGREAAAWIPVVSAARHTADVLTGLSGPGGGAVAPGDAAVLRALSERLRALPAASGPPVSAAEVASGAAIDPAVQELADQVAALEAVLEPAPRG